jgi:hypothetical protein
LDMVAVLALVEGKDGGRREAVGMREGDTRW